MIEQKFSAFILAIVLLGGACGPKLERAVNAVFVAAPIAVDELERQGAITAEVAGQLRVDIPDGKKVTDDLIKDLKDIPNNALDRRARRLAAWQRAELAWLAIVNRGHFALNPKLHKFANRANSLFAAGVQIYGGISAQRKEDGTPVEVPVRPNMTDEEIEQMLQPKLEALRDCLK